MKELIKKITDTGIIPVVKIDNASDAVALAAALKEGGLECAEITFRTDAAEEAIKNIAKAYPDFFIAAGTVLTPEQADKAIAAGATFIVSPGFNPRVVKHCMEKGYPIIPGVCTPSEIEAAMDMGLKYLKYFPAEAAGGLKMLKAMAAPYNKMKFLPTGGLNPANVVDYLKASCVFACGGSWMVPGDKITDGKFDEITELTKEAVKILREVRGI